MPCRNKAERSKKSKDYYEKNKIAVRAQQAEYASTHRREAVLRAQKHHERVKGTPEHRYIQLKSQAKQRGWALEISLDQYTLLVVGNRCTYCGAELPISGHGLDRADNQLGYLLSNVVPCCTSCNTRKGLLEKIGFRYPRTVELLKELLDDPR